MELDTSRILSLLKIKFARLCCTAMQPQCCVFVSRFYVYWPECLTGVFVVGLFACFHVTQCIQEALLDQNELLWSVSLLATAVTAGCDKRQLLSKTNWPKYLTSPLKSATLFIANYIKGIWKYKRVCCNIAVAAPTPSRELFQPSSPGSGSGSRCRRDGMCSVAPSLFYLAGNIQFFHWN